MYDICLILLQYILCAFQYECFFMLFFVYQLVIFISQQFLNILVQMIEKKRLRGKDRVWKPTTWDRGSKAAEHSGFKWLKPAKYKLTCCDFTNFFQQILEDLPTFCFRWLYGVHIVAGICITSQFHDFFNQILAGFCILVQLRRA